MSKSKLVEINGFCDGKAVVTLFLAEKPYRITVTDGKGKYLYFYSPIRQVNRKIYNKFIKNNIPIEKMYSLGFNPEENRWR